MRQLPLFAFLGPVFSPAECDHVVALAENLALRAGTIDDATKTDAAQRNSSVTFIPRGGDAAWLYEKIVVTALQANREAWNFQLDGDEAIQIARYDIGQHYIGHIDVGMSGPYSLRKLSVVVQLSDPADYEGGELVFYSSSEKLVAAPRGRGEMILFPSYALHQVKAVTAGRRYSLAHWIIGREPFR
jgi:PKHD-type hydroxylase